jgi:hypothetical protein
MLMTGNKTIPEMMVEQEGQQLLNANRAMELKKSVAEFQQKQNTQRVLQQAAQQKQIMSQPVDGKISSSLQQIAAGKETTQQVQELRTNAQMYGKLADTLLLANGDPETIDMYRKLSKSDMDQANNYEKEVRIEQSDKLKKEGAQLNVMWQSPEGYESGMANLEKINPELADKLKKQFGNTLTIGAARTIQSEANSRMDTNQQLTQQLHLDQLKAQEEARAATLEEKKASRFEKIREFTLKREEVKAKKDERETAVQRENKKYVAQENKHNTEFQKNYDEAHKEYLTARKAFDMSRPDTPQRETAVEDMEKANEKIEQVNRNWGERVNQARLDAQANGATLPRVQDEFKPVYKSKAKDIENKTNKSEIGASPNAIIDRIIAANTVDGKAPTREQARAAAIKAGLITDKD